MSERFEVSPLGRTFYIRDRLTGRLLHRPAAKGGFIRFQYWDDAVRHANDLNSGLVSPP